MFEIPEKLIAEDGRHSKFGPSSSKRWINCPGSIALIDKFKAKSVSSSATNLEAARGTAAHLLLEICLREDREPWEFIGVPVSASGYEFIVDDDMSASVQSTIDLVRRLMAKHAHLSPRLYIEEDYEYSLDPEVFGKGDIRIVVPSHGIIIIDHKNGSGVMVEPDDSQLKMYGYMGFESTKEYLGEIPVIEMWISQPRKPHKDGPHRSVYMTGEELTNWWLDTLLPALAAAREENALLKTGEWCRFCPAKMDCPATKGEVDDVKIVGNVDTLSNEEIGRLMAKRAVIVKFLEAINAEGNARAKKGEMIPGFKLVHQKGNRAWKDSMNEKDENGVEKKVTFAEAVVARFGKEAYEPQVLKSPPQIEKLVEGSRFVSKWAYTPQTGLTLAPDSDKRAAVKPAIEQFMDDMAAQETKGDDSK